MRIIVPALLLLTLSACARRANLPDYYGVPDFQLTDQTGHTFDSSALNGKIWVADFMYTTCPGPCPRMSSQMHQVEKATASIPGVHMVSFTVDPEHDTPQKLAAYSKLYDASPDRWSFLTGAQSKLQHLCRDVFKLGNVDGSMEHSTRFVLIDRKERVRGYYETEDPGSIPKVIADIHALAREQS